MIALSSYFCCCDAHDLTMVDEQGHHPITEVPDRHGTVYLGQATDPVTNTIWPRGTICPSCPVHGFVNPAEAKG